MCEPGTLELFGYFALGLFGAYGIMRFIADLIGTYTK
jgi:hypothetical protein